MVTLATDNVHIFNIYPLSPFIVSCTLPMPPHQLTRLSLDWLKSFCFIYLFIYRVKCRKSLQAFTEYSVRTVHLQTKTHTHDINIFDLIIRQGSIFKVQVKSGSAEPCLFTLHVPPDRVVAVEFATNDAPQHSTCTCSAETFCADIQEILLTIDVDLCEVEVLARDAVLGDTKLAECLDFSALDAFLECRIQDVDTLHLCLDSICIEYAVGHPWAVLQSYRVDFSCRLVSNAVEHNRIVDQADFVDTEDILEEIRRTNTS